MSKHSQPPSTLAFQPPSPDDSSSIPHVLNHPFFFTAYGPKRSVQTVTKDDRTRQEFKDECDINRILASYQQTGVITHVNPRQPQWGDYEALDFQSSMNTVVKAREDFESLPAKIRDRFDNDPGKLLAFLNNPENRAEAVTLGILKAPESASPTPPSISPAQSPTGAPDKP